MVVSLGFVVVVFLKRTVGLQFWSFVCVEGGSSLFFRHGGLGFVLNEIGGRWETGLSLYQKLCGCTN